jgi:uncharacterized membrane protein YozB (DUF420 family)
MGGRAWLWVGTAVDLLLLAAAFYMAVAAVDAVGRSDRSPYAIGVAMLFLALPVICITALLFAWRAEKRGRPRTRIAAMFAAPFLYAAFLVVFLLA